MVSATVFCPRGFHLQGKEDRVPCVDPETAPSIRNRLINGVFPWIEILPLGKFIGVNWDCWSTWMYQKSSGTQAKAVMGHTKTHQSYEVMNIQHHGGPTPPCHLMLAVYQGPASRGLLNWLWSFSSVWCPGCWCSPPDHLPTYLSTFLDPAVNRCSRLSAMVQAST